MMDTFLEWLCMAAIGFLSGWSLASFYWSPEVQGKQYKEIWDEYQKRLKEKINP